MCVHCREPRLIFALLTAQPLFALKMRWAKIKPQFRASACLVFSVQSTQADKRTLIQGVLIHSMCLFEDGFRAAAAASLGAPSFRRTQVPFASTTISCSCSPWFFVLLFPHDKNFAFIFDMQALVRLFLSCGSPCVRSTSDCAVLLATPGAQSAVA